MPTTDITHRLRAHRRNWRRVGTWVTAQRLASDDAALGSLRRAAAVGDVDAAVQVTRQLLDRFDADGSTDQLYEATIWIDRFHGTETMARSQQIERVSLNYCNQKVLHYHWLCEPGG